MNKYTLRRQEVHELKIDAETEKEAWLLFEATDPEITRVKTFNHHTEAVCESHGNEVNDDYPCEDCKKEAHEDSIYEQEKDRRLGL